MPAASLLLRKATLDDVDTLAAMLVDLYEAELPGALRGAVEKRCALLAFTLRADRGAGLVGRHVVVADGRPTATFSLRFRADTAAPLAPAGTLRHGLALFGPWETARMLGTLARTIFTPAPLLGGDDALLSSVVVIAGARRSGVGERSVAFAEAAARARGCSAVRLQVLASNEAARRFWTSLGYRTTERGPRRFVPTFPVETMEKAL